MNQVKQVGWNESAKTNRFWTQDEDEDPYSSQLCTQVADGKHNEPSSRKVLLGECLIWTTRCGEICQMIGKNICGKKKKAPPCEPTLCPQSCQNKRGKFLVENFGHQRSLASMLAQTCGKNASRTLGQSVRCQERLGGTCDDPRPEDPRDPLASVY